MSLIDAAGPDNTAHRRGVFLVLLAGVFWSSVGIIVRLTEDITEWQILFYRSLGLLLFLIPLIALRSGGRLAAVFRDAGWASVLGGLCLVMAFCGSIFAVKNATVANAMFLFASAPFMAALLGLVILKEKVRRATWIAMAIAGLGIGIMVSEGLAGGFLLGNIAALVSALGFALFTIALRWGRSRDMLPAVCLGGLFTILFAGGACLVSGDGLTAPVGDIGLALSLGVFQLGFGLGLFTAGSKALPAAELALLSMTEVLLGPIWVLIFLWEVPGTYTLLGGALLMGAICGNAVTGLKRRRPPIGVM